jgi:hypothetical protein
VPQRSSSVPHGHTGSSCASANEPATDMDIDVRFIGKQDGKWIIEITVNLENKSQVRLKYENFEIRARYLLPEDTVDDGGHKIHHQLNFPRNIDERLCGEKRFFSNAEYINPKQNFKHRYITWIPGEATFLWVQTKFFFDLKVREKCDGQRIFRVPQSETSGVASLPTENDQVR